MMGTDLLYYIMDYSGNYYRLNKHDQLVTAGCPEEASVFTFAQGTSRISGGKKAGFYFMTPVTEEDEKTETGDSMEENPAETGTDEEDMEEDDSEAANTEADRILVVQKLAEEERRKLSYGEKGENAYDLSEIDWEEYLNQFAYIASAVKNYREDLNETESELDKKICDILHYIELCEVNDEEAVELIELLRVCRENRRSVKDELFCADTFQRLLGTSANVAKAQEAAKNIHGLEKRKYKPRKYSELFENGIWKGKLPGKKQYETETEEAQLKETETAGSGAPGKERWTEKQEEIMDYERTETPFDGKQNDWLGFAKQQAEFYRNAAAYIRNLQMDLDELDCQIEEVLEMSENLNCNVAQGYKVFKCLKELRLKKREKTQELNCMYALTDYMDCEALADACEDNLAEVRRVMGQDENGCAEENTDGNERCSEETSEKASEEAVTETKADRQEPEISGQELAG